MIAQTVTKPLGGEPEEMTLMTQRIANGELDMDFHENESHRSGLYAAIKNMVETLSKLSEEIEGLIHNIRGGRLDQRGNTEAFRGGWRDLSVDLNALVVAFTVPTDTDGYHDAGDGWI